MNYYAYVPREDGTEPLGTENKLIFNLKTYKGAINHCKKAFGDKEFMLFTYTIFYDDKTYRLIHHNKKVKL